MRAQVWFSDSGWLECFGGMLKRAAASTRSWYDDIEAAAAGAGNSCASLEPDNEHNPKRAQKLRNHRVVFS